ncbi:hypothetical protein BS17DRAFT_781610 [Gyrodon lividus]|nr:hypothetical protein BS17DRAFT_781610 [Gyrodon lividus]
MAHLLPSVISSLRKALAWIQFVLRRLAARNVLQRLWSFILRSLRFYIALAYRPEVATQLDQPANAGCGTTPKLTHVSGTVPPEGPLSQSPAFTHTLQDPPSGANNSRQISSSLPTSIRGPVSQPGRPQPVQWQPPSHPPSALQSQAIRPSRSDLLHSARPVVPGQLQRYHRKFERNQTYYTEELQACKLDYTEPEIRHWRRAVHPEGAPYFSSRRGNMHVYTDTDLSVTQHLKDVEAFIRVLVDALTRMLALRDYPLALVLELKHEDVPGRGQQLCFYYFIDHSKQLIFWIHQVKVRDTCGNIRGVKSEGHLRYAIETHYWFVLSVLQLEGDLASVR